MKVKFVNFLATIVHFSKIAIFSKLVTLFSFRPMRVQYVVCILTKIMTIKNFPWKWGGRKAFYPSSSGWKNMNTLRRIWIIRIWIPCKISGGTMTQNRHKYYPLKTCHILAIIVRNSRAIIHNQNYFLSLKLLFLNCQNVYHYFDLKIINESFCRAHFPLRF